MPKRYTHALSTKTLAILRRIDADAERLALAIRRKLAKKAARARRAKKKAR